MGRAISIGASSPVVVLPCCIVIDLFEFLSWLCATSAMRKGHRTGGPLPVCLSICVQRAELKGPQSRYVHNSIIGFPKRPNRALEVAAEFSMSPFTNSL